MYVEMTKKQRQILILSIIKFYQNNPDMASEIIVDVLEETWFTFDDKNDNRTKIKI